MALNDEKYHIKQKLQQNPQPFNQEYGLSTSSEQKGCFHPKSQQNKPW